MAVVSHVYVSRVFGLERGFDVFDDLLIEGGAKNPKAVLVVNRFMLLADNMPPKPYFAFIHFFDPHWSYSPPPPFNTRFIDPAYTGDIDGTYESIQKYISIGKPMPEVDRRQLIAYYDGEIAYVDSQIGRLLKFLEERGMLENTVVVITADHGEEFKDHGGLGHGRTLFREQLSVPLIVAGHPRAPPGTRRGDLVSSCDLAPTLLDLIGRNDLCHFQGRPILHVGTDGDHLVIGESIRFGKEMRAARQGRYKLIHYLQGDKRIFFDLERDPLELEPLLVDPTGGKLSSALADYEAMADSGWHLKLFALNRNTLRCEATIKTAGRFVDPRHYYSKNISGALVDFMSFELSPDGKTLTFDVVTTAQMGEVVFKTDPPEATVTFKVKTTSQEEGSGVFLGRGLRVSDNNAITLTRSDPRVKGMPNNYLKAATGLYIRAVIPVAESAPKTNLSEKAIERLKSLGYIE
jgi:hypothetical protein